MQNIRIRELYFSNTEHPFPSNELFQLFGFTRHNNFVRLLETKDYSDEIIKRFDIKVNQRTGNVYYLTRKLFYELSQRFLKDHSEITNIYLDYWQHNLKSKILDFKDDPKKGKHYTYQLTTLNISKELGIDAYDLFKFCSTNFCSLRGYVAVKFINEGKLVYPVYSWDSANKKKRSEFIFLLNAIQKMFPLTDFQKKTVDKYRSLMNEMLNKQNEYDYQKSFRKRSKRTFSYRYGHTSFITDEQKAEMKVIFRKAAHLCHPDKYPNKEELFKKLNNANQSNDYYGVKEIYDKLINQK